MNNFNNTKLIGNLLYKLEQVVTFVPIRGFKMEEEEFYQNIKKALEHLPDNFNILEEQIDIDVQMKYFEYAKNVRERDVSEKYFEERELLFDAELSDEKKKEILTGIASVDDVKAFRTIEKYLEEAEGEMKQWAVIACQESKMLLQSSLLDEQQIFISTGLGGKNKKLRYFVVFINQDKDKVLNETQQKLVREELIYEFKGKEGELESIEFTEGFSTALVLLPLKAEIKQVFGNVIDECNQFGNFLEEDMIVTNVKMLKRSDVIQILQENRNKRDEELEE